ncbi:MAG: tryptophan 7-halogenase [Nannocystaceae bacterium]
MHSERYDVVIAGGGLAGLTLARQLRMEVPEASVVVVERRRRPLPTAAHKVGESSVELAAHYLGEFLGLGDYLRAEHYLKNGLRFFPGGGQTHALHERDEIGPPERARVPSFQTDRGRLEGDLRAFNDADGIAMLEGYVVKDICLADGDEDHRVEVVDDASGEARTLRAGWVVDASGRRALLRTKLRLTRPSGHLANAAWWRVKGAVDVADLVPRSEAAWHDRDPEHIRWLSTVHFTGEGYWLWYIPLAPGPDGEAYTSIGVVVHDACHSFDSVRTFDRALAWVERHEPRCHAQLRDLAPVDFMALKHYSHGCARCFSPQRWSLVGDAGLFADPLYSPGSDFIALANSFTTELVKAHLRGGDVPGLAERYERFYGRAFAVILENYRTAAPVLGSPSVLGPKLYWDDFLYWAFVCRYFFHRLYRLDDAEHALFDQLGEEVAVLQTRGQELLTGWARRVDDAPRGENITLPKIPSILAEMYLSLVEPMTPDEVAAYMQEKLAEAVETLNELALRALAAVGPAHADELAREAGLARWPHRPSAERVALEALRGAKRRKRLSPVARELERTFGRIELHPDAGELITLVDAAFGAAPA